MFSEESRVNTIGNHHNDSSYTTGSIQESIRVFRFKSVLYHVYV